MSYIILPEKQNNKYIRMCKKKMQFLLNFEVGLFNTKFKMRNSVNTFKKQVWLQHRL